MMRHTPSQSGFNLVELMVAMAIALVAMLAAAQLYVSTKQTYRLQGMQTRLTDDGRFALAQLRRILQQAGFQSNLTQTRDGVFVRDSDPEKNKEFLTPTSVNSVTLRFISDGINIIGCNGAVIQDTATIQKLTLSANNDNSLSCTDGPANKPNIVKWIEPVGRSSELIDFQLLYGTDTSPETPESYGCGANVSGKTGVRERDCIADQYTQNVATNNPDKIVAIQACLVLRSEETDASVTRTTAHKNCSNAEIGDSISDRKLYRTFRTTILLRN